MKTTNLLLLTNILAMKKKHKKVKYNVGIK